MSNICSISLQQSMQTLESLHKFHAAPCLTQTATCHIEAKDQGAPNWNTCLGSHSYFTQSEISVMHGETWDQKWGEHEGRRERERGMTQRESPEEDSPRVSMFQ